MADKPSSGLLTRVLSALVMIPIAVGAVWLGGDWFLALLSVAGLLMSIEWALLVESRGRSRFLFAIAALGLAVGLFGIDLPVDYLAWLGVLGGLVALFLLSGVVRGETRMYWLALALGYSWLPVLALAWLRQTANGLEWVVWVLLLVWGTDIGGYFVGKAIGGKKLAPRISPKKTWAGLFGGMGLAAVAGALVAVLLGLGNPVLFALASAVLAVWAQIGDICESAVKRHFGAKDSGRIIPGHGGILDRVDGLVFVAPVVAAAMAIMG